MQTLHFYIIDTFLLIKHYNDLGYDVARSKKLALSSAYQLNKKDISKKEFKIISDKAVVLFDNYLKEIEEISKEVSKK